MKSKKDAEEVIKGLLSEAKITIKSATDLADKWGVTIYNEPIDVEPSLMYYPHGLERSVLLP